MIYIVVAIRDRAADIYGQPVFVNSLGSAIRSFGDEINNPESAISKHPEDFDLYELGSFNDEDAAFICGERPRQIAIGKDVVRK